MTNRDAQWPNDKRRVAVVTTTIHVPRFLGEVVRNAEINGHGDQLSLIVVGDRKTPPEVGAFLDDLAKKGPAEVTYLDVAAQRRLLRRWPSLDLFLRYDCIQRRNVGYLQAAIDRAEITRIAEVLQTQHDGLLRRIGTLYEQYQESVSCKAVVDDLLGELRRGAEVPRGEAKQKRPHYPPQQAFQSRRQRPRRGGPPLLRLCLETTSTHGNRWSCFCQ